MSTFRYHQKLGIADLLTDAEMRFRTHHLPHVTEVFAQKCSDDKDGTRDQFKEGPGSARFEAAKHYLESCRGHRWLCGDGRGPYRVVFRKTLTSLLSNAIYRGEVAQLEEVAAAGDE